MKDDFKSVPKKPIEKDHSLTPEINSNPEPAFVRPETMAQNEEIIETVQPETDTPKPKLKNSKKPWYKFHYSRKQWIIIAVASVLLIGGGVGAYFAFFKKDKPAVVVKKEEPKPEPPKPTTEPATLTGLTVPLAINKLPVTGVMIENSPDARPQAGLKDAGVVFEAVAEGGITRFLALFQHDSLPDYMGPVRSVRPYYLDYLQGFDAAIAHVGGSPDALAQIKNQGVKDLDQFANGGSYKRVSNRYAPHNVYTSIANMLDLQKKKGFSSTYTGFPRKAEKAVSPAIKTSIDLNISSFLYNVHYDYEVATNSYKRSEGGKPHTDERSGSQLNPKVVIAIVVTKGVASDGVHSTYQNIGSGKAYVFQDGMVTEGTWSKSSSKAQITFADGAGAAIAMNAGQTWISLVSKATDVSAKP